MGRPKVFCRHGMYGRQYCSECNSDRHRELRSSKGWDAHRLAMRAAHYRRSYDLSLEEVEFILSGPCGVCGERPATVVDHDHGEGEVRGGVCKLCNSLLVLLDTPGLLEKAQAFIQTYAEKSHEAVSADGSTTEARL